MARIISSAEAAQLLRIVYGLAATRKMPFLRLGTSADTSVNSLASVTVIVEGNV
jgi:hypothetical protein